MIPRRSWLRNESEIEVRTCLRPNATDSKQMPNSLNRSVVDKNQWWHSDGVAMRQEMSVKFSDSTFCFKGHSSVF
jgi:hypothetical protein